jgi:glycosyltransferase involved in cell wall biosynthesis
LTILFLHPNFPGQFKRLAAALAKDGRTSVVSLGDRSWMRAGQVMPGVTHAAYEAPTQSPEGVHPWAAGFDGAVRRGQQVIETLAKHKRAGLEPDTIIAHPGWGDAFFVRDFFPGARVIGLFEYYYRSRGADVGFDPELPSGIDDIFRLHASNATQLLALESCDSGVCPTAWQQSLFPSAYASRLKVIHDGVDTGAVRPDPAATFILPNGHTLRAGDEVLTYVSRSLEPYRGFHTFMRALPAILSQRPACQVIIVGAEGASYGPQSSDSGQSWKAKYLAEVGAELDIARVHFTGALPYADYLRVLQVSRLHVYLTFPFILSWSMLDAMACGCVVLASDTAPVQEVIDDEVNGYLFPFHAPASLTDMAVALLADPLAQRQVAQQARQTVCDRFDFDTVSLPAYRQLLAH